MKPFFFLLFYYLIISSANAGTNDPAYRFIMTRSEQGTLDLCTMDINGSITISSSYDWGNDFTHMGDIWNFIVSPSGEYVVLVDVNMVNGGIYRVTKNAQLEFIKVITGGFTEGGFSHDGEYYYTTQGIIGEYGTYKPYLTAIKVNGGAFDIVAKQDVPTTGSMTFNLFADSEENLIASAFHGMLDSPGSLVVYHFDREKLRFDLKQYLLCNKIVYCDMDVQNRVLAFSYTPSIGSLVRNDEGKFESKAAYWDWTHWDQSYSPCIRILPDASFAVATVYNDFHGWEYVRGGAALFSINSAGELKYESIYPMSASDTLGMTPDGRYFVVGLKYGTQINVLRINRETRQMEKVQTMQYRNGWPSCIRFLPQFRPKTLVKQKNWSLYSDSEK
jgi:hypothetical protein